MTTTDIYWRVSMGGDLSSFRKPKYRGRGDWNRWTPGSITPGRRNGADDGYTYIDHVAAVVRATESLGFVGGLLPSFPQNHDPWAVSSELIRETSTYRFMVAFQPGFEHPLQLARTSATFQRATGGRLVYNIISGGGGPEQLWWGDTIGHDDRYARTSEFLGILRGVWGGEPFDFNGRFFNTRGAALPEPLARTPFPEIYFSGSSAAAIDAAGLHADYYLTWLEPYESLRRKFADVRERSAKFNRTPRFAVRIDILARHTEEAAWAEIEKGWAYADQDAARTRANGDSVGVQRSRGFLPSVITSYRDLEIEPNVWRGFDLLRGGPAFGLVGSYEQVAERLDALLDLGADAFILASNPHLEEAYRVAEEVLPLLRTRTLQPRDASGIPVADPLSAPPALAGAG